MDENKRLIPIQVAPLHMLVKFDRRKRSVKMSADLLPTLNLDLLDRTIEFDLSHSFKTTIEGSIVRRTIDGEATSEFQATISICPDETDWPEPCDLYANLYCVALRVAAKQVAAKEDPEAWCHPVVVKKQWGNDPLGPLLSTVRVTYSFPTPGFGGELLTIIKRYLDLIRDELPSVVEVLTIGPIPGTTPVEDV